VIGAVRRSERIIYGAVQWGELNLSKHYFSSQNWTKTETIGAVQETLRAWTVLYERPRQRRNVAYRITSHLHLPLSAVTDDDRRQRANNTGPLGGPVIM